MYYASSFYLNGYGQTVLEYKDGELALSAYLEGIQTIVFNVSVDLDKLDKDKLNNYVKYFYGGFYGVREFKTYQSIALYQLHRLFPIKIPTIQTS